MLQHVSTKVYRSKLVYNASPSSTANLLGLFCAFFTLFSHTRRETSIAAYAIHHATHATVAIGIHQFGLG